MRACLLLALACLPACATVHAPESSSAAPAARVFVRADEPGLQAELRPSQRSPSPAPVAFCTVPCTLVSVPGPADVIVSKGGDASRRSVVLARGDQVMRLRPGNRIVRGAGWVSLAASLGSFGVFAVTYATMVPTGNQPQAQPASGTGSGGAADEGASKHGWGGPVVVASISAVIPLLVTGLLLLDYGTAGVRFEP